MNSLMKNEISQWRDNPKDDFLGGLVSAFSVIPEVVGFTIIAGVNPMLGLYTSVAFLILSAFLGGRPAMVSAGAGSMALVVDVYKRQVEKTASSEAIKIQDYIKEVMVEQAEKLDLDYVLMPSGAVHDSNYMAEVTDVAMIFVPSVDGRSHVNEEYTDWDDIKAGVDLLLNTLVAISQ